MWIDQNTTSEVFTQRPLCLTVLKIVRLTEDVYYTWMRVYLFSSFFRNIFFSGKLLASFAQDARSLRVKWANKLPDRYRNINFAIKLSKTIQCKFLFKKKIPSAVLEQFNAYRRTDGWINGVLRALKMPGFGTVMFYCQYVVCPKSKCTDFLFKCLLHSPEITSYLLQSMTLGKLHSVSNVFSTDHSSAGSHFPYVCLAHRLQFFVCFPSSQNDDPSTSTST